MEGVLSSRNICQEMTALCTSGIYPDLCISVMNFRSPLKIQGLFRMKAFNGWERVLQALTRDHCRVRRFGNTQKFLIGIEHEWDPISHYSET